MEKKKGVKNNCMESFDEDLPTIEEKNEMLRILDLRMRDMQILLALIANGINLFNLKNPTLWEKIEKMNTAFCEFSEAFEKINPRNSN